MKMTHASRRLLLLALFVSLASCGAPKAAEPGASAQSGQQAAPGPKRLVVATIGDPVAVFPGIDQRQASGNAELEDMINGGLSQTDGTGTVHAQLAERLPTIENGDWTVAPDGTMETTWRIRAGAVWHDGTPVTAADFVFSLQVYQDKELPFSHITYPYLSGAEALDTRTVRAKWSRVYVNADAFFGSVGTPMPRHLVEPSYLENKASLLDLPVWSTEAVGNGPYRLHEFVRGSRAVLKAFDQYVLGRPKIDEIELRFLLDPNTISANILSGTVEATVGRGLTVDQAVQIRDLWTRGKIAEFTYHSWVRVLPQFVNPNPAVIGQLPFRQALLEAIDRQQMVDTIQHGIGEVAEVPPGPDYPHYASLAASVVRYPYDPTHAARLLTGLGYTRAADGFYYDSQGTKLGVEIRTSEANAARVQSLHIVADSWRQLGVATEEVVVPQQLRGDKAYRQDRPGFEINRNGAGIDNLTAYKTEAIQRAENNYRGVGGVNYPRYGHPELNSLTDRYNQTIPLAERLQVAGQMMHHLTSNLVMFGLYFDVEPAMVSNRVQNFGHGYVWSIHQWDVTG